MGDSSKSAGSVSLLNTLPAPCNKDDNWIAHCVTKYRLRALEGGGQVLIYLYVPSSQSRA